MQEKILNELKPVRNKDKMKWADKLKLDSLNEDISALNEVEVWMEFTLKEANPNYKDPDKFFE